MIEKKGNMSCFILTSIRGSLLLHRSLATRRFWPKCTRRTFASTGVGSAWWRHEMETFSALLTLCEGNSPVTGEFPSQRPVTRSFDAFFDPRLGKRWSKQPRRRWSETASRLLWRHFNGMERVHQDTKVCIFKLNYITVECSAFPKYIKCNNFVIRSNLRQHHKISPNISIFKHHIFFKTNTEMMISKLLAQLYCAYLAASGMLYM